MSEGTETTRKDHGSTGFIGFFRKYVNGWVAAALVLPTAITWKGIPVYESQRSTLVTLNALSCALILSFLFTSREFIPKAKSRIGRIGSVLMPFGFICATAYCVFAYLLLLNRSADYAQMKLGDAMNTLSMNEIHDGGSIMISYIFIVVFAECAFFFMAFREWKPSPSDAEAPS